ncbi:protease synthase and sporulation negative regulatory protein PAI 1 [mine drainage metagenome]|uniref:Protease synthase and sporulation negative regulatory protein PAI 1 n=1 Tax=mine drainage metagenome TaxID=410659 RepID=A0A1J5RMC5_9ZZZZ
MRQLYCRIATVDDVELLASVSRKTFFDTYNEFNTKEDMDLYMAQYFNLQTLVDEINNPLNIFVFVYDGDELSGYVKLSDSHVPDKLKGFTALEISRIYSIKEKIGKGVGKKLLDESIAIAKQKNKQLVWLIVWKENARAISFYQKNGFEIFDEQDFILGTDVQHDWKMKKNLF